MVIEQQYERAKTRLLVDESICVQNRILLRDFFQYQEHKLKRMNGLAALDDACYKTLYGYTIRLRNVNKWFGNKPWTALTKEDIRRVYDDLEDGRILTQAGQPFQDRMPSRIVLPPLVATLSRQREDNGGAKGHGFPTRTGGGETT